MRIIVSCCLQVHAYPHTKEANAHHPFGRIPALNHDGFCLCESFAIARYIDSMAPAGSRPLRPPRPDAQGNAAVDEVSLAASYVFPAVEHGVVKPRLKMEEVRLLYSLSRLRSSATKRKAA